MVHFHRLKVVDVGNVWLKKWKKARRYLVTSPKSFQKLHFTVGWQLGLINKLQLTEKNLHRLRWYFALICRRTDLALFLWRWRLESFCIEACILHYFTCNGVSLVNLLQNQPFQCLMWDIDEISRVCVRIIANPIHILPIIACYCSCIFAKRFILSLYRDCNWPEEGYYRYHITNIIHANNAICRREGRFVNLNFLTDKFPGHGD